MWALTVWSLCPHGKTLAEAYRDRSMVSLWYRLVSFSNVTFFAHHMAYFYIIPTMGFWEIAHTLRFCRKGVNLLTYRSRGST